MNTHRLDPKVIAKISGPSWDGLRPAFFEINDALLGASRSVTGTLTTIYVKYASPETLGNPFAVVWVKKASEIVVGLSLPESTAHDRLGEAPKGCTYAGLTKFLTIDCDHGVPLEFPEWSEAAFRLRSQS